MEYRNRIALFTWGFSATFAALLALLTGVVLRDGPPGGHSPLFYAVVFAGFWLAAAALAAHALGRACITAQLFDDGSLAVRQRFPLRRIEHRFDARSRPVAFVVEGTDGDGDPYFACEIGPAGPFVRPVRIAEGARERCEAVARRLNEARR